MRLRDVAALCPVWKKFGQADQGVEAEVAQQQGLEVVAFDARSGPDKPPGYTEVASPRCTVATNASEPLVLNSCSASQLTENKSRLRPASGLSKAATCRWIG